MHLTFRNVNDAFRGLVTEFSQADIRKHYISRSTSRNGDVLYIQEPVIITYTHPRERVLFNQARDCNPFFHLYEALWMLAGRNDVAPLAYYNSNIANYSDDGKTFNGAYGYRWRHTDVNDSGATPMSSLDEYNRVNQLRILINHLKTVPDSRRAVLQMWNVEDDLLKIGPKNQSRDVCCNTHVYFSLRQVRNQPMQESDPISNWGKCVYALDMTVCNRSNDLIWGLLGANAVHFSFLQEYMAACIGVEVGVYNQITNNCHVYLNDKWQPEKWLQQTWCIDLSGRPAPPDYPATFPLIKDPATFDREVVGFVNHWSQVAPHIHWREPFLLRVAQPMCLAFSLHKQRLYSDALEAASTVESDDWRIAATNWLQKRKRNWETQPGTTPPPHQ